MRLALVALTLVLSGCQRACNKVAARPTANAAEDDLREVLARVGVKRPRLYCDTPYPIDASRCSTSVAVAERDALVRELALSPRSLERWSKDQLLSCETFTRDRKNVERYSATAPRTLQRRTYLAIDLYWAAGETCIELAMAPR